ncbi:three-helix bundle dimerization domain-containing protein [Nonomuraea insulae]|uniref:Three-helix bundle dimerization domain-containing protein n=1 Tax=Nonomuraea insulae TaxID=1616787 RepID=A0ABW1D6D9_9ACTN
MGGGVEPRCGTRENQAIHAVEERLLADFSGKVSACQVCEAVDRAHRHFSASPIRDFVPISTERHCCRSFIPWGCRRRNWSSAPSSAPHSTAAFP